MEVWIEAAEVRIIRLVALLLRVYLVDGQVLEFGAGFGRWAACGIGRLWLMTFLLLLLLLVSIEAFNFAKCIWVLLVRRFEEASDHD